MKMWLDDIRQAPEGWAHLHNIEEVEKLIEFVKEKKDFFIEQISLDYNLGHSKNGADVMKCLADICVKYKTSKFWPKKIFYHSNDPKGVEIMKSFVNEFEKGILKKI